MLNQAFRAQQLHSAVVLQRCVQEPTRLSSPPPRRSIAPICIPEEGAGGGPVVVGGVRSRLSRSPRRSPWDGITAGGASETPAAEPVSGLSALSPLEVINTINLVNTFLYLFENYCTDTPGSWFSCKLWAGFTYMWLTVRWKYIIYIINNNVTNKI